MDGLIITIIAFAVISAASIAINVWQYKSHKASKNETSRLIKDAAKLELELTDVKEKLANETNHREWAIGRIKDQSATIRSLEKHLKSSSKDRWRQWQERQQGKEGNADV